MTIEAEIAGTAADAIPCYECEYDLRGSPESARCPECGADANLSRQRQSLLRAGRPVPLVMTSRKWMRTIAAACGLTILGSLVSMLATGAFLIEEHAISRSLGCAGSALIAAGYFILSQREPASPPTAWTRTVAIIARLAPLLGLLLPMAALRIVIRTDFIRYSSQILLVNSVLVSAITWVLLRHMQKLARRADAEFLRITLSLLKWPAPAAWLCQPFLSTYMFIRPKQWVPVAPYALIGYSDFIVGVPYSMAVFPRLNLELATMAVEAAISVQLVTALTWFSLVLLHASLKEQNALLLKDPVP